MPKPKPSKREVLAVLNTLVTSCDRLAKQYGAKTNWLSDVSKTISNIKKHQALCLREAVKCVKRGWKP